MKKLKLSVGIEGKRVIVQGMGNVGFSAARFIQEAGGIIVGLCEYEGAIYDPNGLDVNLVLLHRQQTGSILNYGKARNYTNSGQGLEQDFDSLIDRKSVVEGKSVAERVDTGGRRNIK